MGISPTDLMEKVTNEGICMDNGIAHSMLLDDDPPAECQPIHPQGVFAIYSPGGITDGLKEMLPEPAAIPKMSMNFGVSAADPSQDSPEGPRTDNNNDWTLDI